MTRLVPVTLVGAISEFPANSCGMEESKKVTTFKGSNMVAQGAHVEDRRQRVHSSLWRRDDNVCSSLCGGQSSTCVLFTVEDR